ncbi:hypothetical protein QBC47DRAFT_96712 [Echria macrotheca]|uniref:Uncharacterized protein n=1 Tax=Echria macrotheca TaxID=438768 RepID=A0AAJ0F8A7_9PEZI|nr:hypothetical protein QBC47DRAFT_96712 [Echria macrotheca]
MFFATKEITSDNWMEPYERGKTIAAFGKAFDKFNKTENAKRDELIPELAKTIAAEMAPLLTREHKGPIGTKRTRNIWQAFMHCVVSVPCGQRVAYLFPLVIQELTAFPFWKDLPGMDFVLRYLSTDPWMVFGPEADPDDPPSVPEDYPIEEYLSLVSLDARLTGMEISKDPCHPLRTIRFGLEDSRQMAVGETYFESRIDAACEYICRAMLTIYDWCKEGLKASADDEDAEWEYGSGDLFPGKMGYTLERWRFWRKRLEELQPLVTGSCLSMVNITIGRMDQVEAPVVTVLDIELFGEPCQIVAAFPPMR